MGIRKLLSLLLLAMPLAAQQPATQTAPLYSVNAKYTNGVAPGYWPQAGSGLTLNVGKGTSNCASTIVSYVGGTLTMANSTTNYVYLDTAASCAPGSNTSGFTSSTWPIAIVITSGGAITSITDVRTMMSTAIGTGTVIGGVCTNQFVRSISTSGVPTCNTIGEADLPAATVLADQSATFGAHTYDFSGVTLMKSRVGAGLTSSANGDFGYDSTNNNWHFWTNAADKVGGVWSATPTNGNCVKSSVSGGVITLLDAGSPCGTGSGSVIGSGTNPKIAIWTSGSALGDIGTPTTCSATQAATGIDTNGNATGCFTPAGTGNSGGVAPPTPRRWAYMSANTANASFVSSGSDLQGGANCVGFTLTSTFVTPADDCSNGTGIGNFSGIWGQGQWYANHNLSATINTRISTTVTMRYWIGWTTATGSSMLSTATPAQNYAAFRYDTGAGDTTYVCKSSGNSGGAVTSTDTFITPDTSNHIFRIVEDSSVPNFKFYIDGVLKCTHTTNIPPSTVKLAVMSGTATLAAVAQHVFPSWFYMESDQ